MFNKIRAGRTSMRLTLAVLGLTANGYGAVVGQWSLNPAGSIWASGNNFSSIYAAVTSGPTPHTVEGPQSISVANLANNTHFMITSEPASISATSLAILMDWVRDGHVLLLFAGGGSGGAISQILAGLGAGASGTAMSVDPYGTIGLSGSTQQGGSLIGPDRAVVGPPTNLTGQQLRFDGAVPVYGGSALSADTVSGFGNALRVDTFDLGRVYVFGSRFDSNSNFTYPTNRNFFINLLAEFPGGGPGGPGGEVPEPATFAMAAIALTGLVCWKRKR